MNGLIIGIIIAAALGGFVFWLIRSRNKKKAANEWKFGTFDRAMKIVNSTTPLVTPNGHKVYFESGTDKNSFSLPACDIGVEKTFTKAECVPYPVDRTQHRISIVVFNAIADSQCDPAFKVYITNQNWYYNSEWDKATCPGDECDHYVLAAGQTIAVGEPYGDVIVVPHHAGKEEHLARVVEYEMEHVILAWADGPRYEATVNHQNGNGHPLLSDCPGAVQFASRPFTGVCVDGRK